MLAGSTDANRGRQHPIRWDPPQDFAPGSPLRHPLSFPQTLTSQAPRIPEGPLGRGVFSGPHPCLDKVSWPMRVQLVSVTLHQIRRTTWSSEIPGLIEFDYRCRSFIASHFFNIRIIEKAKK